MENPTKFGPGLTDVMSPASSFDLTHIDYVEPLSDGDNVCLSEVRDVLARHGKIDRFGVALLHRHFAMSPDEVLVEECDEESRTLTIRPRQLCDVADTATIGTIWSLRGYAALNCFVVCAKVPGRNGWVHNRIHKDEMPD